MTDELVLAPNDSVLSTESDNSAIERSQLLRIVAKVIFTLGFKCGIGTNPLATATSNYAVFADLPNGQVMWPIQDDEKVHFDFMGDYSGTFDGSSDDQKFRRLIELPWGKLVKYGLHN